MPQRLQRRRTKGWRMPEGGISVTRPGPFGNPFTIKRAQELGYEGDLRTFLVRAFRDWLVFDDSPWPALVTSVQRRWMLDRISQLTGHDLYCWCNVWSPCHADVLLELANKKRALPRAIVEPRTNDTASLFKNLKVGDAVEVLLDDGTLKTLVVQYPPSVLGDANRWVVWLHGMIGCYALDRVKRVVEAQR